jgi:hypothetical protein
MINDIRSHTVEDRMLVAMALHHPGAHLHNIRIAFVTALACGITGYLLGQIPGLRVFAGSAIIFAS